MISSDSVHFFEWTTLDSEVLKIKIAIRYLKVWWLDILIEIFYSEKKSFWYSFRI